MVRSQNSPPYSRMQAHSTERSIIGIYQTQCGLPLASAKQSQSVPRPPNEAIISLCQKRTQRGRQTPCAQPRAVAKQSQSVRRPANEAIIRPCQTNPTRPPDALGPTARRCKTKPIPSGAYQTKPSPALSDETCMSAVSRLFSPSGIKTQPSAPPPGHSKKRTHCGAGQRKQRRCFSLSEYFSEEPNAARRTPRTRPRTVAKQSQSASDPYQTKPIARRQPARLAPPWRSACSSNSHPVTKGN